MDELTNLVQEHNVRVFSDSESTEDIIAALIADRLIEDAPVFVVDIGAVKRSYERWQDLLPNVKVHFAMKSNADPVIIQTLAALGSCFDRWGARAEAGAPTPGSPGLVLVKMTGGHLVIRRALRGNTSRPPWV